ncbi:uncharacterized protein APUU_60755S [Aspergillus puulaauensis]|uniref:Uncharacterized protein n=1 Tax=Aspergillus puulaauensis TaxID=1220207 RepID=A0A7R7XUN7_9EURO|nr:uncharacterized protein APUU_60755S [Aspergillus puulaauensis]BCS27707.1 hypothetical protein APUU_60755S [Aspergillus puulaauensis]
MEEIRDTIQKLKHLSDTSDANFNSTTDGNEAAIEATKSRLNEIETGQKDMAKLLDELRGKIAEQHVNSPQEERGKWESLDKQVQKESTSLRETTRTTRSTTEALQSTAATLNCCANVTNNQELGTTAAGRIIQESLRGVDRLPRLRRGERSAAVRGPALSTGPTRRPPRRVRAPLLPPPMVARQIPTGTIPTSENPPPLPPRTVSQGSGVTRPDILEPLRDPSTVTPIEECLPDLPPRPPPSLPTRSDPGSYTFDRRGGVVSPPSLDIPTPSTQRSRLFSSSSTGTESSAMSALVSDPPSLPPSSPRIPPTKPLKPRHLKSKAAVGLEGHNNNS